MSAGMTGTMIVAVLAVGAALQARIAALHDWCEREQQRVSAPCPQYCALMTERARQCTAKRQELSVRLLGNIHERAQWPAIGPWFASDEPDIILSLTAADGRCRRLNAWSRNRTGSAAAHMQLDGDDVCFALSDAEFAEMLELAESQQCTQQVAARP